MKKGFILVELLVASITMIVVLGIIFSVFNFLKKVDYDSIETARTTYNINTIKEFVLAKKDKECVIVDKQLICDGEIVLNLSYDGEIKYYEEDGFKKCLIMYSDRKINFVVKEQK